MPKRWVFLLGAICAAFLSSPGIGVGQEYPAGPVTFIEPFPVGGSIDVVMRAMAPTVQEQIGKPVVIESRPGAAGVIATSIVAHAAPNGQTLLAAASSLAANPELDKSLPFDTLKDLQAVSLVSRTPLVLVVSPQLDVHSVPELIALLKKKPGQINFAHSGVGAAIHLAAELFMTKTGTKMTGVAYRGVQPALADLTEGRVQVMFADAGAILGQVRSGTLRPLGVSSSERLPALPDVPTIAEAGVPGFDAVGWTLICAPAKTPRPIVDRLHQAISVAVAKPEVQKFINEIGDLPAQDASPDQLQRFLASEIKRWGALIDQAGLAKSQ
jgi:tripartite-type tricarboxylate transporter receptor subunit TctC